MQRAFHVLLFLAFSISLFSQQTNKTPNQINGRGSVTLDSVQLLEAFDTLELLFNLSFTFSKDQLPTDQHVTLDFQDVPIYKILDEMSLQASIRYQVIGESIAIQLIPSANMLTTISGKVIDGKTGLPIAYCSIGLQGKYAGTISNSEGEFDFHIREENSGDTLFASMMGYKTWKSLAGSYDNQLIALEESALLLDEVIVSDNVPGANEIISKAAKALKRNYPTRSTTLDGFYRNYFSVNGKYVSILEAAVVIEGGNIKKPVKKDNVFIREIRSNKGLDRTNSLFRESDENFLETLLINDMLRPGSRKRRGEGSLFNDQKNNYVVDTITTFNDRLVYVLINQNYQTDFEVLTTPYINAKLKLFIDADSYAIVRIERISDFDNGETPWILGHNETQAYNMVYNKFVQEYREVKGKMYLNYFSSSFRFDITKPGTSESMGSEQLVRELLINDIQSGRQKEFNWHEEMEYNISLEETIGSYNNEFWDHYNVIKSTPLTEKILKDLEAEEALEMQFKSNKM
jgi:hypothetical protein